MRRKPKVFMRNISAFSLIFLFSFFPYAWCDQVKSNLNTAQAVITKYEETSRPVFDPDKGQDDQSSFQKIRDKASKLNPKVKSLEKKRDNFYKKQREEQRKFFQKIENEPDSEETQNKLNQFAHKQAEERLKFSKGTKKKYDKLLLQDKDIKKRSFRDKLSDLVNRK